MPLIFWAEPMPAGALESRVLIMPYAYSNCRIYLVLSEKTEAVSPINSNSCSSCTASRQAGDSVLLLS